MDSATRRTGIEVIGDVPWGTHFCQFYETSQDLIDVLVPYFKEGLEAGEFCMWVTSEPLKADQATAALRASVPDLDDYIDEGQIEVLDYSQWYTRSGKFSADEVLQGWVDKLSEAQKRGFQGLRLTGNTFWLEKADWDDFTRYEEAINNVIGHYSMLALCTYSLQKCNALEILDVVANHQFALIKRCGRWEIIESSQHKKTEQALRESEKKLSALYSSMVEGVAQHEIVYDHAGNPADYIITDVNPSYEKITGLSRDIALSRRASALYGADKPPYLDVYARVASSGKPESFETYFEPMKRHFSISVFSPGQGKFATVFSDITERRQADIVLQANLERFYAILSSMYAGILLVTDNGRIEYANQAFCDMFDLKESPAELMGLTSGEMIEKINSAYRSPEEAIARIAEIVHLGRPVKGEEVAMKDGRTYLRDFVPLCVSGKSHGRLWHHLDITEQKIAEENLKNANEELQVQAEELQAQTEELLSANHHLNESEEELRKSQGRFKALIQNLSSGVALIDEHGKFTIVNPAFLRMFGLSEDLSDIRNINDQNWGQWQVFDGSGTLLHVDEHPVRKAAMAGRAVHNQLVGVRLPSGGDLRWMLISAEPVLKPDGRMDMVICTYHEVTERKMMEEELRKSRDELEQRVLERTIELSTAKEELEVTNEELQVELEQHQKLEAQLTNAKEAAEEAVKVKAAFMANMSHELRTPMNSVIGFTGLLLEEPLTIDQKDYVESIRNSGEALMTLINEVLDFSRMDREKMDLELQAFDLRNIVEEALDMVASQAWNKGLELNYSFYRNVPEAIIGDPGKLRQVLGNLLGNAVKFTREGEVEVIASSDPDPDHDEIHFAVRDTGIGIPEEDMAKLFQPFCQLDMSYSRGYEGAGLGLAISRKLVELMGGRIWVESILGEGSTFHFTIPVETAPADYKPFLKGSFSGKQVLVVEGNKTLRRIIGRYLSDLNIVPRLVPNLQEAFELLQRDNDFDAVVVDAGKDEVVSTIADKRHLWKQLPVIALTTLGQKAPQGLFQAVLAKPFKPARLFQALQDTLESSDASKPIEASEAEKSYGPLRILLAEDNLSNQKVTLKMLKKLGYRADAVVNGREVLEALERHPYDIVFMDVKMPVMNGIQAAMEIRKRWPNNGPRIIAVTAYALHGDRDKCLAAGMDDYIAKPVQKEDLIRMLAKYGSFRACPIVLLWP